MDIRFFAILAGSSFGVIVLTALAGNLLETAGVLSKERLGQKGIAAILAFYFALFCIMAFSLVPIFVHAFITMQARIGNGEHAVVQWIREHERTVVYGIWTLFGAGLVMIAALAREDILKQLK